MKYFVAIKSKDDCSGALEAARRYSPNIEIVDETTLVFDLTGSKAKEAPQIAAELREKFESVAVSENLAAALLLARWAREEAFQVKNSGVRVQDSDSSGQTLNFEPGTLNPPSTQYPVPSTQYPVPSTQYPVPSTNLERETRNLPMADDELFKTPKSEYRAGPLITSGERFNARADKDRRRNRRRNGEVSSFKFQVSSSGEQTQYSKLKIQKSQGMRALAPDAGGDACAPVVTVRESQEANFNQQTLNSEPGTLNSPRAERARERESGCSSKQTRNQKPGTRNSLSTQYSVLSTLSALPMEAISRKAEFLELMDSWAIHDLGSFAALPEDGMVERFGQEIIELRKQAAGGAFRAPNWNVKEDKFFWAKELEGAIETIEPLNFVLSKGVEQIFQNLDYAGLSTQSAKIILRGREKNKVYRIRIVFPTKNQKLWIRQIVTKIELDTPGFNIDRVEIEFRSTKPRTVQNNLYSGVILEPENLNLIVTKLKKVVGLSKIGLPKLRDSWSEAFYMTEDLSALIAERGSGFRVQSSEFDVENSGVRIQKSDFRSQESGVSGQRASLSEQTLNSEPETLNSPSTQYSVPSTKANPRAESAGGRESGRTSEQTLNSEPGTLNSPSTQYSVPSTKVETRNSLVPRPLPLVPIFYYLPQPIKARVFFESSEPKALIIKGKRELVRTSGGPWRKDAEWYRTSKWQRDEWDIETETGAIYRVYVDKNGEAFVDGGYD